MSLDVEIITTPIVNKLKEMLIMRIKTVERVREHFRERALDRENPDEQIREIWNTSVLILATYELLRYRPIRNIKYIFSLVKRKRQLKRLLEERKSKVGV
jgi:hypothetical protein